MTREEKIKLIKKFCDAHKYCSSYTGNKKDACALLDFKNCAFERYADGELDEAVSIIGKERNEFLKKTLEEFKPIVCSTAIDNNNVNHPAHYTAGGIECIDALKAATVELNGIEAVCTANAIKYLWRWKNKNGVEDLKKAKWYINRLIKEVEHPNVVFSDDGLGG